MTTKGARAAPFLVPETVLTDEPRRAGTGAFFGRRKGKALRPAQARRIEDLLPRLLIAEQGPVDPRDWCAKPKAAHVLEIGFGGGEHLAREAEAHPDWAFLGVEPFVNGLAKMLAEIEGRQLANVRLHAGDGSVLLGRIAPASLDLVYLLYPDPWPKTRQQKRRFVSDATVAALARVLKAGGEFRFATDIDSYAAWTLERLLRAPDFVFAAKTAADWKTPWDGWMSTRYEEKAIREGRRGTYLTFRRV